MRGLVHILLRLVATLLVILVVALGGLVIGLNTGAGRNLAAREINKMASPTVTISGLGGHFPADLKLQDLQLADDDGVWLHATGLELRWSPSELLRGEGHVEALSATQVDVLRQPAASGKKSNSGTSLPPFRLVVDRLTIGALTLAPSLAGEAIVLHVQGAGHIYSETQAAAQLDAATPDGTGQYHLAAAMDSENLSLKLHIYEPPGGLLGHFAGPQVQAPLTADIALAGPRANAALNFGASLGAAQLNGSGNLGLVPAHQFADVTLTVPDVAPFSALAGRTIGGSTQLHLRVAQADHGAATLALDGNVALRQAPAMLQNFLGGQDDITIRASLLNGVATIDRLQLSGTDFAASVSGKLGTNDIALATNIEIKQVATLSPGISGNVTENGNINGTTRDFAVQTTLSGTIAAKGQASDPFKIDIAVQHLPNAPSGTLTGSGMLENAPLDLAAAFAREADGAFRVNIGKAHWRSMTAKADLHLAPAGKLPAGTAVFSINNLQDFLPFVPIKLQGGISGDFAYTAGNDIKLDVIAKSLVVAPSLGAINGQVTAVGPVQALGVAGQLALASLMGHPAQLDLAGVLNVPAQAAQLTRLNGSWRSLNARLQGPVAIETKPAIAVRHLRLALDQGSMTLDGVVWPQLNAKLSLRDLPLSIANVFEPKLGAAGTVSADAALTGSPTAPSGTVQVNVTALHLNQGQAAALSPADIAGNARLAGTSATLDVKLKAGPDIALEVSGQAPFRTTGQMNLKTVGRIDLQLLNLLLAAEGTVVRGEVLTNLQLTGTPLNPSAAGGITLSGGSIQNIGSGLSLTQIGAEIRAEGRIVALQTLSATAGNGTLTGNGTLGLDGDMPIALTLNADNASPVISDLITETLEGKVTLTGALKGPLTLGGNIEIAKANINIPHGLPPSVANLPIINDGETPPPPPAPPPPIAFNLDVRAHNQIFVRGDGLFAELGGHVHLGGTMAAMDPEGKFDLIRGSFSLAGKNLKFTEGTIGFSGDGFMPTLDLVATASGTQANDATLTVGGTAAKPVITLSSTPPTPSDEILAQLLFGQSASSLTPFQAASLAAALAQISGVGGGGANPLDKVRNALGLDELSVGGSGAGPPSLQAGRYVAPGVYVGASQSANGQDTQVNVQINLYKGLKLQTSTGTSSTSGDTSSVGLSYQFNY
jgi:translocation and assembly module TamB